MLLHYVVSGKGKFIVGDKEYWLESGQIFVIHPFEMTYYEAAEDDPWHYIWVGFTSGVELPEALSQDVITLPRAGILFASMIKADILPAGKEAYLCGKIWELIALLFAEKAEGKEKKSLNATDLVNMAKTYMETEYMRGISIAELSERLNLDRSYFSGLFKRETGKSPLQYLTKLRLEKAKCINVK